MKVKLIVILCLIIVLMVSCSPKPKVIDTIENDFKHESQKEYENNKPSIDEPIEPGIYPVEAFLPSMEMIKIFTGGYENAGTIHIIDKIKGDKFQMKSITTGAGVALVYQLVNDEIRLIFSEETDVFQRDYLQRQPNRDQTILKGPIKVGTIWEDDSGGTYKITGIDVEVITMPRIVYSAVEVTYKNGEYESKSYYSMGNGLIKIEVPSMYDLELLRIEYNIKDVEDKKEVLWFIEEFLPIDMGPEKIDLTSTLDHLRLTSEDLFEWMEFSSEVYKYIPPFKLNERIPDGILTQAMVRYCLERYSGEDREDMFILYQDDYPIAVKEEGANKMAEILLGYSIGKHGTSKDYEGPLFIYKDNAYYFDGYSYHGAYWSYINDFIINDDETITIDYHVYYFHENDNERYPWLSTEAFITRVNVDPNYFDPPVAKCSITVKEKTGDNQKGYLIIENKVNNLR